MSIENKNDTEALVWTSRGKRAKKMARTAIRVATSKAAKHVAVVTAGAALVYGGVQVAEAQQPEFRGEQTVQIDDGDTLHDLIKENVKHGADHVGEVTESTKSKPENEDVDFNNLQPGDDVVLDEEVITVDDSGLAEERNR